LNEEYNRLIDELGNRDSYIQELEAEARHLKKLLDNEMPKYGNLEKLQKQNEILKNELDKFKKDNSMLKSTLKDGEKETTTLEKGMKTKTSQLEDYKVRVEELEELVVMKEGVLGDLEVKLEHLNRTLAVRDEEIKSYVRLTQEFNSENKNSIEELAKQATNTIKIFYNNINQTGGSRVFFDNNHTSDLFNKAEIDNLVKENKVPLVLEEVLSKSIHPGVTSIPKELFNSLLFKTELLKTELFGSLIREMGIVKYLGSTIGDSAEAKDNISVADICNLIVQQIESDREEIQKLTEENGILAQQNGEFEGIVNTLQENMKVMKNLVNSKFSKIDGNIKSLSEQKLMKSRKMNELSDTLNHYKKKADIIRDLPLTRGFMGALRQVAAAGFTINRSIIPTTTYTRSVSQSPERVVREVRYERLDESSPKVTYVESRDTSPMCGRDIVDYKPRVTYVERRDASPQVYRREEADYKPKVTYVERRDASPQEYRREEADYKPKITYVERRDKSPVHEVVDYQPRVTYMESRDSSPKEETRERPPKIEYVYVKDKPKEPEVYTVRSEGTKVNRRVPENQQQNVKIIYTTTKGSDERISNYGLRDDRQPLKEVNERISYTQDNNQDIKEIPIIKKKPERGILKNTEVNETLYDNYDYELQGALLNNNQIRSKAPPKRTSFEENANKLSFVGLRIHSLNNFSISRTYHDKTLKLKPSTVNYFSIYSNRLNESFNEKSYHNRKEEVGRLKDDLAKSGTEIKRLKEEIASILRTGVSVRELMERKEDEKRNYRICKNYFSIEPIDIPRTKSLDESISKLNHEQVVIAEKSCQNCQFNAEILNEFKNIMKTSTFKELKQFYTNYQMDIDKVSSKFEELANTFAGVDKQLADSTKKIKKEQIRDVIAHLGKFVSTLGSFMTKYNKDLNYNTNGLKKIFDFISRLIYSNSFLSSFSSIKTTKTGVLNGDRKVVLDNMLKIIFDINKVFSPSEYKKLSQLYEGRNVLEVIEVFRSICDVVKTNMLDYKLDYESKFVIIFS
jgi:hypothetical protein